MTAEIREARLLVDEDPEAVFRFLYERGATDGLPVIPPTPERVERMLAAVDRPPDEVVAVLPPRDTPVTLEAIAVNTVLAGCLPEYFPVVVAAVEAVAQPEFGLAAVSTTTCGTALLCLVNGPIRHRLAINSSYGVLGPGWRANATIGRALRLVVLNVGGAVPREVSQSTMATPGRYTLCAGEFEERSPWAPLHVERGFAADESTVTVAAVTGTLNIVSANRTATGLLTRIAHSMDASGTNDMIRGDGEPFLLLCPDHADLLAQQGFSKADVKRFLYERTRRTPIDRFPAEEHDLLRQSGRAQDDTVALVQSPDQIQVVVAGGLGGLHSCFLPTFAGHSKSVTHRIEV